MDGDARRHLADLVEESLALGFERVELEHEAREGELGGRGWRLTVGAGDVAGTRLLLEAAIQSSAGGAYLGELTELLRLWSRHGIPAQDRPLPRVVGPVLEHSLTDLAFFVGVLARGTDRQRDIAHDLLARGVELDVLTRAFREAFEADVDVGTPHWGSPA